jgi:hypothetical protein
LQKRLLPEIDRHGGGGCKKRNDNEREHVQCANPAEPVNARKRFDGVFDGCVRKDIYIARVLLTIFQILEARRNYKLAEATTEARPTEQERRQGWRKGSSHGSPAQLRHERSNTVVHTRRRCLV